VTDDVVYTLADVSVLRAHPTRAFELHVPSFVVRRGERLALIGRSGCGKSTLLDLLALIVRPGRAQHFHFHPTPDGPADIGGLHASRRRDALAELRGRHIGYVLQTGGLLGFLSVRHNILLGRRWQRPASAEDEALVEALAERLDIARHLGKKPGALSAGERQRVAIARALANAPEVILADEPTAALDPDNAARVMHAFVELAATFGITLVVVSHDRDLVHHFGLACVEPQLTSTARGVLATFVH